MNSEDSREPGVIPARIVPVQVAQWAYVALIGVAALVGAWVAWDLAPADLDAAGAFVILLALGVASAILKVDASGSDVDVSFTSVVLLAAMPLLGPFLAMILAALVPLAAYRRHELPAIAFAFNSLMYSVATFACGVAYLAFGGALGSAFSGLVAAQSGSPASYLLYVALPLLAADLVLCIANAALLAGMMVLSGTSPWSMLWGPAVRTLPLYLGYGLTAFLFAVLWGPAGLGPLAAVFILAPLIVARWAYRQYVEQREVHAHIIDTLAAAGRSRDRATGRAARVAEITRLLQVELQLGQRDTISLTNGTALHDIGMLAVPRSLLRQSPGRLVPAELRLLASHSEVGYDVVRDIDFLADTALVVRHHHERFDGSGYPAGLLGDRIPLAARVLAVADAYEAAAWSESGRAAPDHQAAWEVIRRGAATAFDPEIVRALERALADVSASPLLAVGDVQDVHDAGPAMRPATGWVDRLVRDALGRTVPDDVETVVPRPVTVTRDGAPWVPLAVVTALSFVLPFALTLGHAPSTEPGSRGGPLQHWAVLLVYLCTLVAAERFRVRRRGRPEAAPMALATGLALALTTAMPGMPDFHVATGMVVGSVAAAIVIDWVSIRWRNGGGERANLAFDAAVRLGIVAIVSFVIRDLPLAHGRSLDDAMAAWNPQMRALVMAALVVAVLIAEVPVRAWWRGRLEFARTSTLLREQFRNSLGLGAAMAATGVLVAATEPVLGLFALPLVMIPLAITQLSVRWHEDVRFAHLQAIRALSRLPESAGLVPQGHAARVALLSVAVGRELGMSQRDVEDVEQAALLHDVGQVSLRRPIPSGATVLAAPGDQERIARLGAEIVAQTGDLKVVSQILQGQAVPYHRVVSGAQRLALGSRIIKVVNAYDDFFRSYDGTVLVRRMHALERLYLGLGHEFDPVVVEALERVLGERSGPAEAGLGTAPPGSARAGLRSGGRVRP